MPKELTFGCHRCGLYHRCRQSQLSGYPRFREKGRPGAVSPILDRDVFGTQPQFFRNDNSDNRSDTCADILRTGDRFDGTA